MDTQITDYHYDWQTSVFHWTMIRDALKGESAVKIHSELYLPMPAGMELATSQSPSINKNTSTTVYSSDKFDIHNQMTSWMNPNYHTNPAYQAYKARAQFPEITTYMLRGLLGIAQKAVPSFELPRTMEYLEEDFTKSGTSMLDFYFFLLKEILAVGRIGCLVDVDDKDGELKVVTYSAESIVDWEKASESFDEKLLKRVILAEYPEDHELRRMMEVQDGIYGQSVEIDNTETLQFEPVTYHGKPLKYVPMCIAGSTDIMPDVDYAPMYGIARTALQIYQLDADLRQGEYMSCNPTLFISGIGDEFAPQAIGSTFAVILPPSEAKAYYPATDTSALAHVANRVDTLFDKALMHGVGMLKNSGGVESGEALRIKQTANNATLSSAVAAAAKAMEFCLKSIAEWKGLNPDQVEFEPNFEFTTAMMTPQEQTALVQSWMNGAISKSTMLENFRRSGMLQEGETVEDEMDRLEDDEPLITETVPRQENEADEGAVEEDDTDEMIEDMENGNDQG